MGHEISVNEETCIGCGTCEHISEDHFEIVEKEDRFVAIPIQKHVEEISGELNEAKDICPVSAIKISVRKK